MYTIEHKKNNHIIKSCFQKSYADFKGLEADLTAFNTLILSDIDKKQSSIINDYLFEDENAFEIINKKTDFLIKIS